MAATERGTPRNVPIGTHLDSNDRLAVGSLSVHAWLLRRPVRTVLARV
jgi:hypothetical protein